MPADIAARPKPLQHACLCRSRHAQVRGPCCRQAAGRRGGGRAGAPEHCQWHCQWHWLVGSCLPACRAPRHRACSRGGLTGRCKPRTPCGLPSLRGKSTPCSAACTRSCGCGGCRRRLQQAGGRRGRGVMGAVCGRVQHPHSSSGAALEHTGCCCAWRAWGVGRLAARRQKVYLAARSKPAERAPATASDSCRLATLHRVRLPLAAALPAAQRLAAAAVRQRRQQWGRRNHHRAHILLTCRIHRLRSSCRQGNAAGWCPTFSAPHELLRCQAPQAHSPVFSAFRMAHPRARLGVLARTHASACHHCQEQEQALPAEPPRAHVRCPSDKLSSGRVGVSHNSHHPAATLAADAVFRPPLNTALPVREISGNLPSLKH